MPCTSCGSKQNGGGTQRTAVTQYDAPDGVTLQFTGRHVDAVQYRANQGRSYKAGNNIANRFIVVHPDDVKPMLRHQVFEIVEAEKPAETESEPVAETAKTADAPEPVAELAPAAITFADIEAAAKKTAATQLADAGLDTVESVSENLDELEAVVSEAAAARIRKLFN